MNALHQPSSTQAEQSPSGGVLGLVLNWTFGILLGLLGLLFLFSFTVVGMLLLVMAGVLLPPINSLLCRRWRISVSPATRTIVLVAGSLLVIYAFATTPAPTPEPTAQPRRSQVERPKMKPPAAHAPQTRKRETQGKVLETAKARHPEPEEVNQIRAGRLTIYVGQLSDDVFRRIDLSEHLVSPPTTSEGTVTQHLAFGNTRADIDFSRPSEANSYRSTVQRIVILNRSFTRPKVAERPPVKYEVGDAAGAVIAFSVPHGTTKQELRQLLRYFHGLNQKGELMRATRGHSVIWIFEGRKWAKEENFERLVHNPDPGPWRQHIRAVYSLSYPEREESAIIGDPDDPNHEALQF